MLSDSHRDILATVSMLCTRMGLTLDFSGAM